MESRSTAESRTTIVSFNLDNHTLGIIGADGRSTNPDFGDVVGNEYEKIITLCDTVYAACSGNCDLLDFVRDTIPVRISEQKPASMAELVNILLEVVNMKIGDAPLSPQEKPVMQAHMYVIGTVGDVQISLYEIRRLSENSRIHSVRELDGDFYGSGSGRRGTYAFNSDNSDAEDGHLYGFVDDLSAVWYACEAITHAIRRDPLSGGEMTIISIRHNHVRRVILVPDEPGRSRSTYSIDSEENIVPTY